MKTPREEKAGRHEEPPRDKRRRGKRKKRNCAIITEKKTRVPRVEKNIKGSEGEKKKNPEKNDVRFGWVLVTLMKTRGKFREQKVYYAVWYVLGCSYERA